MGGGAGFAQQPLFSSKNPASPAYGKYTDAAGKKLRRGATGPDNDRTENRDGAETCHHNNRYPRRFWRIRRQTEHHAA
ncbi:lipoprotein [Salmonella sp. NCTC 11881]|nr:lipoprotein [Salmonella sp. NCTC 11881]